ncbi:MULTISPECIES: hypothetical protein [Planktothrix]|uniref:hypothetical protein n=1 Tax=Planktothrix TaxID=54304 RepID=UPI00130E1277|nr:MULTISPECIES: hypothetical protein [Planktothrix]
MPKLSQKPGFLAEAEGAIAWGKETRVSYLHLGEDTQIIIETRFLDTYLQIGTREKSHQ